MSQKSRIGVDIYSVGLGGGGPYAHRRKYRCHAVISPALEFGLF